MWTHTSVINLRLSFWPLVSATVGDATTWANDKTETLLLSSAHKMKGKMTRFVVTNYDRDVTIRLLNENLYRTRGRLANGSVWVLKT